LFRPDPAARLSVRKELSVPDDAVLVGMVARFHPVKDHRTFLRAAQLLHSRLANARFVLVGSGITRENAGLCRMVDECGLADAVDLLGPRTDVPRLTAALDVACLSSWSESSPFVLCEAMCCGVPCVASDVGDSRLLIGDTGKIVPPRNPQALADALLWLLQRPLGQLNTLGQMARKRASMFSLDLAVDNYKTLYAKLTEPDWSPGVSASLVAQGLPVQIDSRTELTTESATEEVRP
jgi:glycosyltransferase involved in cell wall biosynthesis